MDVFDLSSKTAVSILYESLQLLFLWQYFTQDSREAIPQFRLVASIVFFRRIYTHGRIEVAFSLLAVSVIFEPITFVHFRSACVTSLICVYFKGFVITFWVSTVASVLTVQVFGYSRFVLVVSPNMKTSFPKLSVYFCAFEPKCIFLLTVDVVCG